ncbi:MAG: anti-sigma factor [Eubacteriales bacterium]|nr:anti-sigma factor [Eubacteriales bacterium]
MKCNEVCQMLDKYIDNELDNNSKSMIDKHLAVCPQCRKDFDESIDIIEALRRIPQEELPENFSIELHAKLAEVSKDTASKFQRLIKRPAIQVIASAAAAIVIFVAGGAMQKGISNILSDKSKSDMMENANYTGKSLTMAKTAEGIDETRTAVPPETPTTSAAVTNASEPKDRVDEYTEETDFDRSTTVYGKGEISSIDIIVSSNDPQKQLDSLKDYAITNGIAEIDDTEKGMALMAAGNSLTLNVSKESYYALTRFLENNYSQVNVRYSNISRSEPSYSIEELNIKLGDINELIRVTNEKAEVNSELLNKLEAQKEILYEMIQSLETEKEMTTVNIFFS